MGSKDRRRSGGAQQQQGAAFGVQAPPIPGAGPGGAEPEFDPARPRKFDLGGFISGATSHISTRTHFVTFRPDAGAELEQLVADREKLQRIITREAQLAGDDEEPEVDLDRQPDGRRRRMAEKSGHTERLEQMEARIVELEAELQGTWAEVKIRTLEPTQQDQVRMMQLTPGVPLAAGIFSLSALVREPGTQEWSTLSQPEWVGFINAIGMGQYLDLDKAHTAVTYQTVTPDFYAQFSASRTTASTSSS